MLLYSICLFVYVWYKTKRFDLPWQWFSSAILTPGWQLRREVPGMVLVALLPGWQPRSGRLGMVSDMLL